MATTIAAKLVSDEITTLLLSDSFPALDGGVSGVARFTALRNLLEDNFTKLKIQSDTILEHDAANVMALRDGTNAMTFRVYTTWTDISNRENIAITGSAITVETAGTGANDIDLTLTPAGTGVLKFGSHTALGGESVSGYITIKDSGGASRKVAVVT